MKGLGQLTNIGKQQHYNLGEWYRSKYQDFIPDLYSPEFFRVHSSNVDRCLMSASSHLAGLYPPVKRQIWNENLLWQPIPIHSTAKNKDPILAQDFRCEAYYNMYHQLMESDEFLGYFEQLTDLIEFVSTNSGQNITTLLDLSSIQNTLYIEKLYNLTLPDWAEQVYDQLQIIANETWFTLTYNQKMARLWSGPFINYVATNLEGIINNVTDTPKYLVLSGHDTTIATLLNSLGLFDGLWPEYASSVIFELRKKEENEHFINMYYKNSTFVKNLILEGCDFDCEFTKFQEIIKPVRIDEDSWLAECNE